MPYDLAHVDEKHVYENDMLFSLLGSQIYLSGTKLDIRILLWGYVI